MLRLFSLCALLRVALTVPEIEAVEIGDDGAPAGGGGLNVLQTRQIPMSQLKVDFNFKPPGAGAASEPAPAPKKKKKNSVKPPVPVAQPDVVEVNVPATPAPAVDVAPEEPFPPADREPSPIVTPAVLNDAPLAPSSDDSPPSTPVPKRARKESKASPPAAPPPPPPPRAAPKSPGAPPASVLRPGAVLQLPPGVVPRSLALAPLRRAFIVTDETVYPGDAADAEGGWPWPLSLLWPAAGRPSLFAYVVGHTGAAQATLPLSAGHAALPHGAAELEDRSIALTYYQAPIDNVELWSPDLSRRVAFHDLSLKPAVPVAVPAALALRLVPSGALLGSRLLVPFTVGDRQGEEGSRVIALMLYNDKGSRVEAFSRRQLVRVKYPHQAALYAPPAPQQQPQPLQPFLVVAGLNRWAWVDGTYGPELRPPGENEVPYCWVEVYRFSSDRSTQVFRAEQASRWDDDHPGGEQPTAAQLVRVPLLATLEIVRSYVFPFTCVWPLFALTPDGFLIAACHGGDEIRIFRLFDDDGEAAPRLGPALLSATQPFGIRSIGALVMDGEAGFLVLDTAGARVVAFPWPLSADDLQNLGMARKPRLVEGIERRAAAVKAS